MMIRSANYTLLNSVQRSMFVQIDGTIYAFVTTSPAFCILSERGKTTAESFPYLRTILRENPRICGQKLGFLCGIYFAFFIEGNPKEPVGLKIGELVQWVQPLH